MLLIHLQLDETVGFPESGMSLPIKIGRIDIPAVLQEASTQLHHKGRVGFYCGGRSLCCNLLCCAVLCCAVLCCAVLCCAVLCCAVLCCAVLCCAVLCCAVPILPA